MVNMTNKKKLSEAEAFEKIMDFIGRIIAVTNLENLNDTEQAKLSDMFIGPSESWSEYLIPYLEFSKLIKDEYALLARMLLTIIKEHEW